MTPASTTPIPRSAGILIHPTCLPGPYGIGDLGPEAERFIDWAATGGQSVWQVLPLGPTGDGNPPYTALSALAGNPLLISPERLVDDGLLPKEALEPTPTFREGWIDFGTLVAWKSALLRRSWDHFRRSAPASAKQRHDAFISDPGIFHWLEDWALFSALRSRFGGRAWLEWDRDLRLRDPASLGAARCDLAEDMAFARYAQFLFFSQWDRLKAYANERGVQIMGDIPIYVALDSADVWANPYLFALDEERRPQIVSGVPPDMFSSDGQLWGHPLFRWDRMEEERYAWWIERMRINFRFTDLVRIDHFRGFEAYWAVPAGDRTAINGRWVPGPGRKLFDAVREALNHHPIVAEDLGYITPEVRRLRDDLGFPGMKVLQFGFGEVDSEHLPHHHIPGCVVYTGTHDNDTTRGWFASLDDGTRQRVIDYVGGDVSEIEWEMIRAAQTSVASLAIVPVQDVLSLGSEARMNTPGTTQGNWIWRAHPGAFRPDLAERLRRLAAMTGRIRRR